MTEKLIKAIESQGWKVYILSDFITISQHSPLGEDYAFVVCNRNDSSIVKRIMEHYQDFDPEEHAYNWYKNCEHSLKDLLEDAEYIKEDMLKPLALDLFDKYDEFFGKENRK